MPDEATPAAADIEQPLTAPQMELPAHVVELFLLGLVEVLHAA